MFSRLVVRLDLPGRAPGGRTVDRSAMLSPQAGGDGTVIKLGDVVMILDLHRQGLSVSAIAVQLGIDRKTVRKDLARAWRRRSTARASRALGASSHSFPTCVSGSGPGPV